MKYLEKESIVNGVLHTHEGWQVTDGYCKRAIEAIDPIINEYEARLRKAVLSDLERCLSVAETWSEQVRECMPLERKKEYVDGYNAAVSEIKKRVDAVLTYTEDVIVKAFKEY